MELDDSQVSLGEGASFADEEVVELSASLDRLQVFDNDFVLLEALDGHSHGDGYCKWEAFWHRDDKDHHTEDAGPSEVGKGLASEEVLGGEESLQ